VLNDEDSGNEPSGDDCSISEKQPDQDQDDRSEIEIEVTDAEHYKNSAEEFMMAMGVRATIGSERVTSRNAAVRQ